MENSATTPLWARFPMPGRECVYILYFPVSISKVTHVSKRRAVLQAGRAILLPILRALLFAGFVLGVLYGLFYDKGNEEADGRR